jgi:hypothetical protein
MIAFEKNHLPNGCRFIRETDNNGIDVPSIVDQFSAAKNRNAKHQDPPDPFEPRPTSLSDIADTMNGAVICVVIKKVLY